MGLGWSKGPELPDSHRGSIHDAPQLPDRADLERPEQADAQPGAPAPRGIVAVIALVIAIAAAIIVSAASSMT